MHPPHSPPGLALALRLEGRRSGAERTATPPPAATPSSASSGLAAAGSLVPSRLAHRPSLPPPTSALLR